MEFNKVINRRRMVRNYAGAGSVPREQIERIMAVAGRAPSAGFAQGQSFIVVTDAKTRQRIGEIGGQPSYTERGFQPWISEAPVHIILCTSPSIYSERYAEPDKAGTPGAEGKWPVPWWHWDAGASFMLLLLAAVNEGLAAGFLAFQVNALPPLKELLGIPEEVTPLGVVTIGKPAATQPKGSAARGRKPPAEVIHWEKY
ncbi:MAG: nitroreductase family protein [Actinomycetota bacterium]